MLLQMLQDLFDDMTMFIKVCKQNQDVVQVHGDFILNNKVLEDVVHEGGEGAWGVCLTEEHIWLKQTAVCDKCSVHFVPSPDPNVVVSPLDFELVSWSMLEWLYMT